MRRGASEGTTYLKAGQALCLTRVTADETLKTCWQHWVVTWGDAAEYPRDNSAGY